MYSFPPLPTPHWHGSASRDFQGGALFPGMLEHSSSTRCKKPKSSCTPGLPRVGKEELLLHLWRGEPSWCCRSLMAAPALLISIIKQQPCPRPQLTHGGLGLHLSLAMTQGVSETPKQCPCSTSLLHVASPASRRDQTGSTPLHPMTGNQHSRKMPGTASSVETQLGLQPCVKAATGAKQCHPGPCQGCWLGWVPLLPPHAWKGG